MRDAPVGRPPQWPKFSLDAALGVGLVAAMATVYVSTSPSTVSRRSTAVTGLAVAVWPTSTDVSTSRRPSHVPSLTSTSPVGWARVISARSHAGRRR